MSPWQWALVLAVFLFLLEATGKVHRGGGRRSVPHWMARDEF